MEHFPSTFTTPEAFIHNRARIGAGLADEVPFQSGHWPMVQRLDLSHGGALVGNAQMAWLNEPQRNLHALRSLDLRHTSVDHEGLGFLTWPGRHLSQLTRLVVSHLEFCDLGARELSWPRAGLPHLRTLIANRCGITETGLWELLGPETSLRQLRVLDLSMNTALECTAFQRLSRTGSGTPLLRRLNMAHSGLDHWSLLDLSSGHGHADLWPKLRWLSLAGNSFDDHDLWHFMCGGAKAFRRLQHLDICGTTMVDKLFEQIAFYGCVLKKLHTLALRENHVTDESLAPLGDPGLMPALRVLDVRKNRVSIDAVARLRRTRPGLRVVA